jgi:hypothetical protein
MKLSRMSVVIALGLSMVAGLAYASDSSGEITSQAALVTVLGLNALSTLFSAVFGGNGSRGVVERVAVLETKIDHAVQDMSDIKMFFGCDRREPDKKTGQRL